MSAPLAPYPAYKSTEAGERIPTHWQHVPLKHSLTFCNGQDHKQVEVDTDGYPVFGSGGVFTRASSFLHEGESILFGRKGTIDKPLYVNGRFWTVDTMYFTRVASDACARFIYYSALCIPYAQYSTNTALPSMTQEVLRNYKCPVPTLAEQICIASFLDRQTAKIDALIEKQQQLIDLLKEKRQAVISHAVTKGLNPDAPMRDSGVEWLGEVPAHWDARRLKFLVSHVVDCHHSTPKYDPDAAFPALRTADVSPGCLDIEGANRVHADEYQARIARLKPEEGDIIYSREGERWGMAALIPKSVDLCLAQRVMLFRAMPEVDSRFLMWALNSNGAYNQLACDIVGATSPHVNIGDIREVWLAVPPIAEQNAIALHVQKALQALDRLDATSSDVIATLQERRAALISAAVTGKIDVRGWKPPEAASESASA